MSVDAKKKDAAYATHAKVRLILGFQYHHLKFQATLKPEDDGNFISVEFGEKYKSFATPGLKYGNEQTLRTLHDFLVFIGLAIPPMGAAIFRDLDRRLDLLLHPASKKAYHG